MRVPKVPLCSTEGGEEPSSEHLASIRTGGDNGTSLEGSKHDDDYPAELFDEYGEYSDDGPQQYLQAMRIVKYDEEVDLSGQAERLAAMSNAKPQRTAMRVTAQAKPRPSVHAKCITIHREVNGLKGKILLNSGSLINAISPSFVMVAKITAFPLENPIGLQLGCVGSWSKINFGVQVALCMGGMSHETYLDVVNIDHYDMILGIPFL
ncbi:hypothetical protein BC835DRAFT_1412323 [Cytidiella melzeri]|nr:hypothetical protein BC835DRAFT_1412323 [Cytidiella melzeri]